MAEAAPQARLFRLWPARASAFHAAAVELVAAQQSGRVARIRRNCRENVLLPLLALIRQRLQR